MPNGSNPAFVSTQGERLPVRRNKDGSVMMDERGLLDLPFLVLVLMMIFRPGGLLGSYDFSMSRIVEKIMNGELFQKKAKEGKDHE